MLPVYSTLVGAYPFNSGISPSTWFLLTINSFAVSFVYTVKSKFIAPFSSSITSSRLLLWLVVLILALVSPYQSVSRFTSFLISISWFSSFTYVPVSITLLSCLDKLFILFPIASALLDVYE